jgi:hypothetical protein
LTYPSGYSFNEQRSSSEERVLWKNEVLTGIIHRRVIETQVITTKRVLKLHIILADTLSPVL